MIRTYIPLLLSLLSYSLLFSACTTTTRSIKTKPILYSKDFEVQYRLEHQAGDSTTLFLSVESNDYELSYQAYSVANENIILEEETVFITNQKNEVASRTFQVRDPEYFLRIFVKDRTENRVFQDIVKVDKSDPKAHIILRSNGEAIVRKYLPLGTELDISHSNKPTLWVKYFSKEFKAAAPPFSDKGYKFNPRKHISQLVEVPNGGTIKLAGEGLYFIQSDTSLLDGIYINVFNDRYPRISSAVQMAASTRYIMKSDEYRSILNSNTPKNAIDDFWVKKAKDKELARELIKTYYTRVQIANRDFTTYKEGWKTDRGMLYILFGPPNQISKKAKGEIWSYASSGKRSAVRFEFKKIDGQTLLSRSDYFKRPWDIEVYEWRSGILNE